MIAIYLRKTVFPELIRPPYIIAADDNGVNFMSFSVIKFAFNRGCRQPSNMSNESINEAFCTLLVKMGLE